MLTVIAHYVVLLHLPYKGHGIEYLLSAIGYCTWYNQLVSKIVIMKGSDIEYSSANQLVVLNHAVLT